MDNNNEYKRDFGGTSGFSSYDELPKTDDYSNLSQYESSVTSDLGGYYTASYNGGTESFGETAKSEPTQGGYYAASYNGETESVDETAKSESVQGGYYAASYNGETKPADEAAKSNDLNGGMSQSDYQALYSDYNGSQTENYRTSPYSAATTGDYSDSGSGDNYGSTDSYGSADSYESKDSYKSAGSYESTDSYENKDSNERKDSYENKDSYESADSYNANSSYSSYNSYTDNGGYNDYNAPEQDYASYGNTFGASNGMMDNQAMSGYANTNTSAFPVDKKGRPLKNNFGMKMVFSIIEVIFATLWGVLALIFTCMANNAYQKGDWETFKSKSKLASIMLWIGFVLTVLSVLFFCLFIGIGTYSYMNNMDVNDYVYEGPVVDDNVVDDNAGDVEEQLPDEEVGESTTGVDFPEAQEYNKFKINGTELTVPGDVSDYVKVLKNSGYVFEDEFKNAKIEAHESSYFTFVNEEGDTVGFVDVYNTTDNQISAKDGIVGGVNIDVGYARNIEINYMDRFDSDSTSQDYIDVFGMPNSADDSRGEYQWYTDEGWISIDITEGKLDNFSIYAYEGLR